jgi:DNA-binding SARP family transcriptional activator
MRGLDADNLNECFYRGLMRVHHASGERAQAMSLYARLQETLSAGLGIQPSRETQGLYEQISRDDPAIHDSANALLRPVAMSRHG